MLKVKEKCPNCGHEFTYSAFQFNSTIVCEKCKRKFYVETRTSLYMMLLIVFLFGSDYIVAPIASLLPNVPAAVHYVILFVIVLAIMFLLQIIMIRLFGFTSVYRIRDDEFYKDAVRQAQEKKQNRKNKKRK